MFVWIVSAWSNKDQIKEIQFIETSYEAALEDVQTNRSGFEDCCYDMCCIKPYQTDRYLGVIDEKLISCCKYNKKSHELEVKYQLPTVSMAFKTQYFRFNDKKRCWEECDDKGDNLL